MINNAKFKLQSLIPSIDMAYISVKESKDVLHDEDF